jgi:hypothetical protein
VPRDRVTAILYTKRLFLGTQYIALSTYQTGKNAGGEDMDSQHDTLGGPAGSYTSQLDLTTGYL